LRSASAQKGAHGIARAGGEGAAHVHRKHRLAGTWREGHVKGEDVPAVSPARPSRRFSAQSQESQLDEHMVPFVASQAI
jgi:hypothetical protein